MDNRPIGVFDSGVGGLTAVKQLRALMPQEDIIYFGDTGRVPYGTRSRKTILKYALEDISFLLKHTVKMIVAACGTVSSTLTEQETADLPVPYTGVVSPTAAAAVKASKTGRIGVIGTGATIRSGSFERQLKLLSPETVVVSSACPLFVPLAENCMIERGNPMTSYAASLYLQPILDAEVDTLILGCTHFPLLADIISDTVGGKVRLIDSGFETAGYVQHYLKEHDQCADRAQGALSFYVSDNVDAFTEVAGKFLGSSLTGEVHWVDLDTF